MTDFVQLFEVGPRDGLQNEKRAISAQEKINLIDRLSDCGLRKIEATSFVSPRWVPQMADASEVMAGIRRTTATSFAVLVPNMKGFEAARTSQADEVAVFTSASETFSRKNINCSINESFERFRPILTAAAADGIPVRGYVSCVTDCPYDGAVAPSAVAEVTAKLLELGCYEVSLGDTIGHATPDSLGAMLDAVLVNIPTSRLAGHYHDTNGRAAENILASLDKGLRTFDTSVGGLGGCPYAPGAKGNADTLLIAVMLADKGYETGLDIGCLREAAHYAKSLTGVRQ